MTKLINETIKNAQSVELSVNGEFFTLDVEPRMSLADCLRGELGLTGTHVGCEHGVCGACTVIKDGLAVRSCLTLAVQAQGAEILTVEGLSTEDGELTSLQKSFRKHHALQCGFCTPGIIATAHALLTNEPDAGEDRIMEALSGNLCRCTGYIGIVNAVKEARQHYKAEAVRAPPEKATQRSSTSTEPGLFKRAVRYFKR